MKLLEQLRECDESVDWCGKGGLFDKAANEIERVREALEDMFALIDENQLVRNIENDDDPLWALNSLAFVRRLAKNQKALDDE